MQPRTVASLYKCRARQKQYQMEDKTMMKEYRVIIDGQEVGKATLTAEQVQKATADGVTLIRA